MKSALEHVRRLIAQHEIAGVVIVTPTDLHYLTGLFLSRGVLFITPQRATLCVDPRYLMVAKSLSTDFEIVCQPSSEAMKSVLEAFFKGCLGSIGFDAATMTVERFQELTAVALPGQLTPAPLLFSCLRRPKRPDEIKAIQEACTLCEKGFTNLLPHIHAGVTEQQLSQKLKAFWFSHGAEALSFEPIIAFGANSACPHWSSSATPLSNNSHILIDIGVKYHSYHSDMTRTIFFGRPDPKILDFSRHVQEAYSLAFAHAWPGVAPFLLDATARHYLAAHGYGDAFVHGLGHGVGLEVHEPPRVSAFAPQEPSLEEGDVITIEPGIYIEGLGGVRLENTVVIETDGARSLFALPLEPTFL